MNPSHVRYLERQRDIELARVFDHCRQIFAGKCVLEVGSGTGRQLLAIRKVAGELVGVEIHNGLYDNYRQPGATIVEYDGRTLPFKSESFDVVFSSHVLEHFTEETVSHREMLRVLKKDGYGVHVVPTRAARLITMAMPYPDAGKRLLAKLTAKDRAAQQPTQSKPLWIPAVAGMTAFGFRLACLLSRQEPRSSSRRSATSRKPAASSSSPRRLPYAACRQRHKGG